MTSNEKRLAVRKKYDVLLGRNYYSQPRRAYCFKKYSDGRYYSDCSSSVSYAYREAGFSFGILNTVGMYNSAKLKKVDVPISSGVPQDMSRLRVGDLLLFAGTDSSRAASGYVGHVEMVYSVGETAAKTKICGHGGTHPRVTDLLSYCRSRQNAKTKTKRGNRGLIKVVRFLQDDDAGVRVTGGSVNVRSAPNKQAKVLGVARKGDVLPLSGEAADGWHGVVYGGGAAFISARYSEVIA